jgi:hypothetical protein
MRLMTALPEGSNVELLVARLQQVLAQPALAELLEQHHRCKTTSGARKSADSNTPPGPMAGRTTRSGGRPMRG